MAESIALIVIVLVAAFLQGLTGFGFGLIALPLLGLFMNIKTCVPLMMLLAVIISLYLTIRLRKSIHLKSIYTLLLATLPGIFLGVYILKHISTKDLSIGLGILMVLFTSYQLLYSPRPRQLGNLFPLVTGFLSGMLGGSTGAGGPPVVIYAALQPWSKDQAKATLACYFAISGIIIVLSHAISGMITPEVLHLYYISLPALVAGIFLGTRAYKYISDYGYRKLAFIMVFLLGLMMIYRNI